jgi:hypothetical protein
MFYECFKIKSDPVRHEEYTENERDQYKARRDRGDFDLSQKTERTQTNPKDMARDKKKSENE